MNRLPSATVPSFALPLLIIAALFYDVPFLVVDGNLADPAGTAAITPVALRTEYKVDPIGIDAARPRPSWQNRSQERSAVQSAFRIQVALQSDAFSDVSDLVWDSGRIESDESVHIEKPDGSFQDVGMNSFNHYAYGAIVDWMYRVVAGINIDPQEPGYKHVIFRPQPGGELPFVRAGIETIYGEVTSSWELVGDELRVSVSVPANTMATVHLPGAVLDRVTEGGREVASAEGVRGARQDSDVVVVEIGSGSYAFAYEAPTIAEKLRPADEGDVGDDSDGGAAAGEATGDEAVEPEGATHEVDEP